MPQGRYDPYIFTANTSPIHDMQSFSASAAESHVFPSTSAAAPVIQRKSWLARSRAWISILLLVPVGVLVILSHLHFPLESLGESLCTLIGYVLFFTGFAWRWWATLYISGVKDKKLVTQGPYAMCRNPLYFGTFLLTLSIACVMQSLTLAVVMLLVSIYYLGVTIPNEESRLEAFMGQDYRDYKSRVPRFWPRFALYHSDDSLHVSLDGVYAEFFRTLRYAAIPIICHALLHLRQHAWWPEFIQLP